MLLRHRCCLDKQGGGLRGVRCNAPSPLSVCVRACTHGCAGVTTHVKGIFRGHEPLECPVAVESEVSCGVEESVFRVTPQSSPRGARHQRWTGQWSLSLLIAGPMAARSESWTCPGNLPLVPFCKGDTGIFFGGGGLLAKRVENKLTNCG